MHVSFDYLTDEQRKALSAEEFGDPARRLFPILTQDDVDKAPRRIKILPNFEEVKSRIMAIAQRKGFNIPEEWSTPQTQVATASSDFSTEDFSSNNASVAEFALDPEATKDSSDGEYVLRTGKIFEAGQYKDKNFEISPEELCEAIAEFEPVDLDLEHMPTILDGKLGKLQAVALANDGKSLIGTVTLPKWLDKQLGEAERKVSATWDRVTKKLTKLALVRNPRVRDAAIYAAFMANEFSDKLEGATESEFAEVMSQLIEEHFGKKKTWNGQSLMQGIHDMAARGGAVCTEGAFSDSSNFVSQHESKVIQQVHDAAVKGGATCNFMSEGSGTNASSDYSNKGENDMTLDDVKKFFKNMPEEDEEVKTEKTELSAEEVTAKIQETAKLAAQEAVAAYKAQLEQEAALKAEEDKAKAEAEKKEAEEKAQEAPAEEETEETDEAQNSAEQTEREKQLEAELAELRSREVEREAEKFADTEIRAERAYPAERNAMIALFKQAYKDDNASEAKITFKQGETEVEGSRVEALKALYSLRQPHNFSFEEVEDFSANVLTTNFDNGEDYLGEAERQAKEYAAKKRASGKASY